VRYLILEVHDRAKAQAFLAASAAGETADVPAITRERAGKWAAHERPTVCFNIGVTSAGLRALGVSPAHLATFPTEFVDGMAGRAMKLGDFGESAPSNWAFPFDQPERVHVIASVYANNASHLGDVQRQVAVAFTVLGTCDGASLPEDKVHFNYRDSISQPRFAEVYDPNQAGDTEPIDPLGTVLLGYPTRFEGVRFGVPSPEVLGKDGTFNAFRILKQDTEAFEAYLTEAARFLLDKSRVDPGKLDLLLAPGTEGRIGAGFTREQALREVVAAQMCGRWRNGMPYATSPDAQLPDPTKPPVSLTNFDYTRTSACPAGSHIRRCNPRGGPIVQRIANYTRRLVRRGMPYEIDDGKGGKERGLLGNFIGASPGAQFEAVMCDWLNLGLQDPDITGSNDPLIGANTPETSWFDLRLRDGGSIRLRGFPRFVTTRGGAYLFLPSLPAIRYLAGSAPWPAS
jgi:deferrochelatase/peroxidase EfeB